MTELFIKYFSGQHEVRVEFADVEATGSPFAVEVFDATKVAVGFDEEGIVGREIKFESIKFKLLQMNSA